MPTGVTNAGRRTEEQMNETAARPGRPKSTPRAGGRNPTPKANDRNTEREPIIWTNETATHAERPKPKPNANQRQGQTKPPRTRNNKATQKANSKTTPIPRPLKEAPDSFDRGDPRRRVQVVCVFFRYLHMSPIYYTIAPLCDKNTLRAMLAADRC